MKVLVDAIIFQKDPRGGIARLFREVLPRMCDMDAGLHITLFTDGPLRGELPQHAQISVQRAPAVKRMVRVKGVWRTLLYPFRRVASRAWNLVRSAWLGEGQSQLWHSTFYTLPEVWRGGQVLTVCDMLLERYRELYADALDDVARAQKRRCIEKADAVICISQATLQDVEHFYGVPRGRAFVIPLACSPVFHRLEAAELPGSSAEPFLLYVSGRRHYKNFLGLLDAYRAWPGNSQVGLRVVGAPWEAEEERRIKDLGLVERVHLLTGVDDVRLCQLYNQALAFVYPSLYEGFGIPLLEAMGCGCPIVASRIPSTLEVAGDCPIYFEPAQPETFVQALSQVQTGGRLEQRVQMGLQRAGEFSWERTARQTLDVYRAVAEQSAPLVRCDHA